LKEYITIVDVPLKSLFAKLQFALAIHNEGSKCKLITCITAKVIRFSMIMSPFSYVFSKMSRLTSITAADVSTCKLSRAKHCVFLRLFEMNVWKDKNSLFPVSGATETFFFCPSRLLQWIFFLKQGMVVQSLTMKRELVRILYYLTVHCSAS